MRAVEAEHAEARTEARDSREAEDARRRRTTMEADEVFPRCVPGLGRIAALYYRSFTLYQIH